MKRIVLVLAVMLFTFAFLSADVYIKTKTHTDGFEVMGQSQPAKDQVSEQWIGDGLFAQVAEGQSMVVDMKKNVAYIIYHSSKSYVEAALPLDLAKLLPPEAAQMMGMMKMTVSVAPAGDTKKIGNWNCKGYDVKMNMMMMSMNMKAWATTDVPFDWKGFQEKWMPVAMQLGGQGMGLDENTLKEFKKIEGFQVATETTMDIMGQQVKATTAVVEITKKAAPAGTYSVPAGYKKQDTLTMQRGM